MCKLIYSIKSYIVCLSLPLEEGSGMSTAVPVQSWLEGQVNLGERKKKQPYGSENYSFVVEEGVFVIFDKYKTVPTINTRTGRTAAPKIVSDGVEKIFVPPGTKVTIYSVRNLKTKKRAPGSAVATFFYTSHQITYKYKDNFERKIPRK